LGSDRGRSGDRELIDFASSPPLRGREFNARLSVGAVTLTHCTSGPIEGRQLGAAQITVAVHDGATFDMDWRGGESDRLRSRRQDHVCIVLQGRLVRKRCRRQYFHFEIGHIHDLHVHVVPFVQGDRDRPANPGDSRARVRKIERKP
jgi:hypothetical protein